MSFEGMQMKACFIEPTLKSECADLLNKFKMIVCDISTAYLLSPIRRYELLMFKSYITQARLREESQSTMLFMWWWTIPEKSIIR